MGKTAHAAAVPSADDECLPHVSASEPARGILIQVLHEEEPVHSRLVTRLAPLLSVAALLASCSDLDRAVAPKLGTPLFNHTVTPTGPSRIVFQSNRDGDVDIYSMNTDGSDVTQLTFNTTLDLLPIWSPDGSRIVWGACDNGSDVAVLNADGSDPHVVFHNGFPGAWSPDGNRIAFSGGGDFGEAVWVINADGSGLTRVADGQFITGWSPDGKQLQLANDFDGDFEIYVLNLDSGLITQITNNTASDFGNGGRARRAAGRQRGDCSADQGEPMRKLLGSLMGAGALLVAAPPAAVRAQTSFDSVAAHLKPGQHVRVHASGGPRLEGPLAAVATAPPVL